MEPGTLPCPVCRTVVCVGENDMPMTLAPNQNLDSFTSPSPKDAIQMKKMAHKLANKRVTCDVCKYKKQDVLAKDHCANCGINYCEHCSHDHSKHCLFKNHSVVPVQQMDSSNMRCEYHDAETVKYFCSTCLVPLCTVCAVSAHKNHDTAELNSALGNKREIIQDRIAGMSEKVMSIEEFMVQLEDVQSLKEASVKKTRIEIERHVSQLINSLHAQKHAILEELERYHEYSMKQISDEKENAAFQLANMKSLWKFAAKLTDPSQSLQLLAMYPDLIQMIDTTVNKPDPSVPKECILMNMFMPKQDMTIGDFQKCELSSGVLQKVPTSMTNGRSRTPSPPPSLAQGISNMAMGAMGMTARPKSPGPPSFFKDPFKEMPSLKWMVTPKLMWKVDKVGGKVGEICESYDVALLPDGSTVVAEWMNQRLQIFDEKGKSQDIISVGQIQPWGLTVTREGNLAVTDDKDRTVKILTPLGQIVSAWKKQCFGWPRGIVENSLGQFVVSDTEHGKHTVSIHLPDGRLIKKFGSQGSGNAQFHWPRYVTVDHDDRIIVSDGSNHCIKILDPNGHFLLKFGSMGSNDGQLKHPRGVCVDPTNNIIVADQDNNRITLFNPDGKFLRHLLNISKPWGVFVSEEGLLAVTNKPSLNVYKIYDLIL